MSEGLRHWEELRREARQIENEIDAKLLVLSRHGSKEVKTYDDDDDTDKVPLLSDASDVFERICGELEQLLTRLTDVNNRMSQYADQLLKTPSATYTLQRHADILKDYSKEFQKTKSNILTQREREQLLKPATNADLKGFSDAAKRSTQLYQKEQEHIRNSENLVDVQIDIAIRTRETMRSQRTALKAIQTQMTTLANRFPIIGSLIHRINVKKKKDTIILGSVIGVCLFLLLLYML